MLKGMGGRKVGRWRRQRRRWRHQGCRREVAHRWETRVQTLIAQWSSPMHLMQRKSFIDWVINRWLLDRCQIYSCLRRWPRLTLEEWILCKTFRGVALLREIAAGLQKKIHWLPASVYGPFCGDVLVGTSAGLGPAGWCAYVFGRHFDRWNMSHCDSLWAGCTITRFNVDQEWNPTQVLSGFFFAYAEAGRSHGY